MFNIVLVNPKIHTNTGSIGRMCVNSGAKLHLIKPLGFEIDDKHLRRAGLDYWASLEPIIWESLEDFLEANLEFKDRFFFATTKCNKLYFDAKFAPGDYLIFGAEDCGLPIELMKLNKNNCITIPMTNQGRSLNLATSVGIITYEEIRQNVDKFYYRDSVREI